MAKTKISEFSSTPANNTDIDSINIAEGCAPSNINDAIRELMAQLKDFQIGSQGDSFNGPIGTTTAAAGAFTTLSASSTVTLSGGTANGVTYLNGSKVLTSGSALTFDGTTLGNTKNDVTGTTELLNITRNNSGTFIKLVRNAGSGNAGGLIGADSVGTYYAGSTTANMMYVDTANTNLQFYVNSAEGMRLTSTGLGIGTSSFTARLTSKASANNYTSGALALQAAVSGTSYLTNSGGSFYISNDGSTDHLVLSSAGNLGLGVTPTSIQSGYKAIQIGATVGGGIVSAGTDTYFTNNAYVTGGAWYFGSTGYATYYNQSGGVHSWTTSTASGSGGGVATMSERMRLDTSGNLLVGATSGNSSNATTKLQVTYSSNTGPGLLIADTTIQNNSTFASFVAGTTRIGSVTANGTTAVAYNTSSDYRLKHDIQPMTGALAKVATLKPVTYKWNADGSDGEGFIAHELAEVCPDAVSGEKDAVDAEGNPQYQGIDTSFLVATLTAALQELNAKFDAYVASHP